MEKKKLSIISNIQKNVHSRKWKCIINTCSNVAINSHLLQRNGILDKIAEDGHLIELRRSDIFKFESHAVPIEFKRLGISNALALPLFCSECDSSIFKKIESDALDTQDYESLLLLSYRAICAEQRKKERVVEIYKRIMEAKSLRGEFDRRFPALILKGNELGIKDLDKFKKIVETEIRTPSDKFYFVTYKYPLIKVYGSAVFSVYDAGDGEEAERTIFDDVLIHIIPSDETLSIVCGYLKEFSNKWVTDYVDSWRGLEYETLTMNLTNLFASRIENWGLAPSLYQRIPRSTIDAMLNFWGRNSMSLSRGLSTDFNFFI